MSNLRQIQTYKCPPLVVGYAHMTHQYTEAELRDAGASDLFIRYYKAAPPSASARWEVEAGPFDLEELNDRPHVGGHFFSHLWEGDADAAWARADLSNRAILEDADLQPATA